MEETQRSQWPPVLAEEQLQGELLAKVRAVVVLPRLVPH